MEVNIIANNIKGITIEIGGSTDKLTTALKDVDKQSKSTASELREIEKGLKFDPTNVELLAQKQKLLGDQIGTVSGKLATLKEAQRQADEQFKNGTINEDAYRGLQREIISTEGYLKTLESQLKSTNDKWDDFGKKAKEVGSKVTDVGKGMSVGVTAPILAIGAAATVAWKEVDDATDGMITKTGATGEKAEALSNAFKNVASTVPTDLETAGNAVGEVSKQFGLMGTELETASTTMVKFAAINNQDVSSSAISAKQAIEKYGLATSDLDGVLDAVTKTSQTTGVSTTDLFSKVTDGSVQIQALGLNFAEATQMVGQFEQSGIDSSKALGYLSKAQVTFAKDGKTLEQGLNETVAAIKNSKSETEALTLASEVFGTKGATFMLDAINKNALSFDGLTLASQNASGAVSATFDATLDPIDQATIAMNNLKLAGADLGTSIQTVLAPVLLSIVTALQGFATWFGSLSDSTKTTIVVIAGIVAAIGPLLIIIGQVISAIGVISGVIGAITAAMAAASTGAGVLGAAFTILTGPIGIIVAAIAALIAIFVALYKNNEEFRTKVNEIWEGIKTSLSGVLTTLGAFFKETFDGIKTIAETVFLALKIFWDTWGGAITAIFNVYLESWKIGFKLIFETISFIVKTVFDVMKIGIQTTLENIGIIVSTVLNTIKGMFTVALQLISGDWSGAWETLKNTFINLWSGISSLISNSLDGVKDMFGAIVDNAFDWGKNMIGGFIDGIKAMVGKVRDAASSITDAAAEYLGFNSPSEKGAGRFIVRDGANMISGFLDGVKSAIPDVASVVGGVTSAAGQSLNSTVTNTTNTGATTSVNIYYPQITSDANVTTLSRQLQSQIFGSNRAFGAT